jgi:hypothetical protein
VPRQGRRDQCGTRLHAPPGDRPYPLGPALAGLAHIDQGLNLHAEALALMDRSRALGFDIPEFRYFRAIQLMYIGRIAEAQEELEGCLRLGPTLGRASLALARLRPWNADDNHLHFIRRRLLEVTQGTEDHAAFEFAQYKELEDLGQHDESLVGARARECLMHARLNHSVRDEEALFDAIIARCDGHFHAATGTSIRRPIPIFIVGMPRSGTTLLERILGNHSEVTPAGELADFSRQWRWVADEHGHRIVDLPLVGRRAASISPKSAGVTSSRRSGALKGGPITSTSFRRTTCWPASSGARCRRRRSCIWAATRWTSASPITARCSAMPFAYSYDLGALAAHHQAVPKAHAALARGHARRHPRRRLFDARAGHGRRRARALLEFCGLPFEAGCIDTAANPGPVATLSSAQVRERIHTRGLQEWKPYAAHLDGLRQALG